MNPINNKITLDRYIKISWKALIGRDPDENELSDSRFLINDCNSNIRFLDALKKLKNIKRPHNPNFEKPRTISVVINTCNRCESLKDTITGLLQQTYENTEIVVVMGPCTDQTEKVLEDFASVIKLERCSVRNLSVSRNIGINAASGDVVAFIDDDAVPVSTWCETIINAYSNAVVGGVGGWVIDNSGINYQTKTIVCDRFACATIDRINSPSDLLNIPFGFQYSAMIGTNSSFRRDILLSIGGFDEEYEYFLDETDVCVRVIDEGFKIVQVPSALVFHRFLPSHIRSEKRIITAYYPILKNSIYFILKNNGGHLSKQDALTHGSNIFNLHLTANTEANKSGHVTDEMLAKLPKDYEKSVIDAVQAYDSYKKRGHQPDNRITTFKATGLDLKTIPAANKDRLNIVLLCRTLDLCDSGIAKFVRVQAEALQKIGHTIHVLTLTRSDRATVEYERGVWIHRLRYREFPNNSHKLGFSLHDSMWNYSMTMYEEVCKISEIQKVDMVESPIWDCEGVAFVYYKTFPHVVHLETTMGIALQGHPDWQSNKDTLENIIYPAMACETYIVSNSDVVRPLSLAMLEEFEAVNKTAVDRSKVVICPVAVIDKRSLNSYEKDHKTTKPRGVVDVMFLGRFEERKGIDVLLDSIPKVIKERPQVHFTLVGDNSILNFKSGKRFDEEFLSHNRDLKPKLNITGRLTDDQVNDCLKTADIFVAPSRFESFGIINVEAMMHGVPVISCEVGGIKEVIKHNVNGILIPAGSSDELSAAIIKLVDDGALRERIGSSGRSNYEKRYTPYRNALQVQALYFTAISRHRKLTLKDTSFNYNVDSKDTDEVLARLNQMAGSGVLV
jgi:glycogen(starch) synthase